MSLPELSDINIKINTDLCKLFKKNSINKSINHNYTKIYSFLFKSIKDKFINLLEINPDCYINNTINMKNKKLIYNIWSEYFLNSNIFTLNMKTNNLIYDLNLNLVCNQEDEKNIEMLYNKPYLSNIFFDIIIENGSKTIQENICFFEKTLSLDKLNIGGFYIIENIHFDHVKFYKTKIGIWKTTFPNYDIKFYAIPKFNVWDNNILIAKRLT
jgi:hypothetical protein